MLRSSFSHICFSSAAPGLDWQNLLKPAHSVPWVELLILPVSALGAGGHVATFSGGLGGPGRADVVGGSDRAAAAREVQGGAASKQLLLVVPGLTALQRLQLQLAAVGPAGVMGPNWPVSPPHAKHQPLIHQYFAGPQSSSESALANSPSWVWDS